MKIKVRSIPKVIKTIQSTSKDNMLIIRNTFGAFFIKGASLIISLLSTPAFINYFNNQTVLGVWFTMLSVLQWILNFDLGIGNGLRNKLVEPIINNDHIKIKKYISSAYFSIGILSLLILMLFPLVSHYINWNNFFNISPNIIPDEIMNLTVVIVFSGIIIQLFLKIVTSVLLAMQKSALTNLLNLFNSVFLLIFITLFEFENITTKLIAVAIAYSLSVNIPLIIASIIVFGTTLKQSKPNYKFYNNKFVKEILKLGGTFFWIQIMYMLIFTSNELLISWFIGADKVVEYQIYNKSFNLFGTLFSLALTPIWSAVTKASKEGKMLWIKKLFKLLSFFSILAIIGEFLLIPLLPLFFEIWLGENAIEINYFYSFIFALSGGIYILNSMYSSIANGLGLLKPQAILFTLAVIVKIPISWILVNIFESWIYVIVAHILSMSVYCIIQPIWINKYINKTITKTNVTSKIE